METPKEWPQEIAESYDPLRVLGTGGFASVVLARRTVIDHQQQSPTTSTSTTNGNSCRKSNCVVFPKKVAIKVVGGSGDGCGNDGAALLYAQREIEVLQQINHCGIVRLFDSWNRNNNKNNESNSSSPTAGVLVLEYIKGPTLESLLKHGGALSTTFGRVIIAQVMDAVAYLHYRAVLHRDIKPDNIIVSGALSSDDFIWDNNDNDNEDNCVTTSVSTTCCRNDKSPDDWKRLCLKYKAKIIDFGFARALTPDGDGADADNNADNNAGNNNADNAGVSNTLAAADAKQATSIRHPIKKDAGYHNVQDERHAKAASSSNNNSSGLGKLFHSISGNSLSLSLSRHNNNRQEQDQQRDALNDSMRSNGSVSHTMKRVMSTLGNRDYAAPEIVNKVRRFSARDKKKELQRISKSTKTISAFVADYGLLVDSYSMGHTIRYMMTGVQPGVSVEETIKKQQRSGMAKKVFSKLGLGKKKKNNTTTKAKTKPAPRKPKYRSLGDLPGQIFLLVEELTELDPDKRISIRKARRTVAWISEVLSFQQNATVVSSSGDDEESAEPTTSSSTSSTQVVLSPSLEHVSEEQLHSLYQTRYLPMATVTPDSVVSTRRASTKTVVTTIESMSDLAMDLSDSSIHRNDSNTTMDDENNNTMDDENDDDAIGLCLEDETNYLPFDNNAFGVMCQ